MTYSIIQKSQLEGASRLDAEYYQLEYLKYSEKLNQFKLYTLGSLTSKIDVGFVSSMVSHFQDEGIPLLRTKNVQEFFVDPENDTVYIDEEFHERLIKSQVFPGYLLLARSGSIGNVGIVPENFPVANSADIILIKVNTDNVIPEFLAAFLNSRYGRFQVERGSSGGLQGHINLFTLEKLQVPIFGRKSQEVIKNLITAGLLTIDESKTLYEEAENLLLEELGLKEFEIPQDLSFVVNFSEVNNANRIDADFSQPKYNRIIENISKNGIQKLGDNFDIIKSRSFSYNDNGEIGVIKTKQLGKQFVNFEVESKVQKEIAEKEKLPIVEDGDVLFASMGVGSLGKTNMFYEFETDEKNFTIDSTLRIFRINAQSKLLPEVLAIYLNTTVGQELIYKYIVGTSGIISIYENYLHEFAVPILDKTVQKKIADLVKKSHEARKKSKQLLEEAKRKVEKMIEK